jgi:putative transposase
MLELVSQSPRNGYRQITHLLRIEGWCVNAKRIYRLWRREGLKVPQKKAKRTRQGSAEGGITRCKAAYRNHVWSMGFIFDTTSNGCPLKILSMIDEYTRERIALEVGRKFNSDDLVQLLIELFGIRGVAKFIRCDNGPEFISNRLRKFLQRIDMVASYVEPGSPWQNGYIESFHSRFRDECLGCEGFRTVAEAIAVITHWRQGYHHRRPHSSLGGLSPAEFSSQCAASDLPQASLQHHTADSVSQPLLS